MRQKPKRDTPFYRNGLFAGYADYRYGPMEGREISLAGKKQEKPIFNPGKRDHMVSVAVEEMSGWRLTPFEKEGPMREALRSTLCLAGHSWRRSDAEAEFVVGRALKAIGIPRPSHNEGQPGYSDSPDRCSWCGTGIDNPTKASRFCSELCARSAFESRDFGRRTQRDSAYAAAQRVIQRSKNKDRTCGECGATFKPIREKSDQRFCSFACGTKFRLRSMPPAGLASVSVTLACIYCGADFEARQKKAIICSSACSMAYQRAKKGQEPQRLKPHVFDHYITMAVQRPGLTVGRFDFWQWQLGGPPPAPPASGVMEALFGAG